MATSKAKESCGLGKQRKITAPSSLTISNTPTKRTPKSSPRGHSTDHKLSFSSSSSSAHLSTLAVKHVPNYLKSTASSRHEHSSFKPTKKSGGPAPIPEGKPSLNRRRSFDKQPPTAPRLDKPFRSPGPRNRVTHVPVRSSSFGAKSTTTTISSAKPGFLERSASKISKGGGGKPQVQPVQTLKSSSIVKRRLKRESSNAASASASAEMVPKTKNSVEHVDRSPSFVLGMNNEELKKIECELDPYLPDIIPEFDKELRTDHLEKKAVLDKDEAVVSNKEVEETPRAAETEISKQPASKSLEQNEGETEEDATEEENPERIGVEKEEVVAVAVNASQESTDNKNEQKIETNPDPDREGGEGAIVLDETEAEDGLKYKEESHKSTTEKEAEAMEKAAAAAAKPRQGGAGRKESPAMYNHVIEETASKLLEKRKNKVRALAGAFQTVIDYESSSK